MTPHTTYTEPEISARRLPLRALAALVFALLVLFIVSASMWAYHADLSDRREECHSDLEADVLAKFGLSLDTPPSPSPERLAAAQAIVDAAERLERADELCPAPFNLWPF